MPVSWGGGSGGDQGRVSPGSAPLVGAPASGAKPDEGELSDTFATAIGANASAEPTDSNYLMTGPPDLRALAGDRFRIVYDPTADVEPSRSERPWFARVACRSGFIAPHGPAALAAFCDRPRLFSALTAIPGAKVRQRGDREIAVVIGLEHLDTAAAILGAYRRRRLSREARERATARLAAARAARSSPHSRAPGAAPRDSRPVGR